MSYGRWLSPHAEGSECARHDKEISASLIVYTIYHFFNNAKEKGIKTRKKRKKDAKRAIPS
jgi:hypothetical protein